MVASLQSTNPLGKCVEYLQEDLESMAAEQRFWQAEYQTYQVRPAHQCSALRQALPHADKAPARLVVPAQVAGSAVHGHPGCMSVTMLTLLLTCQPGQTCCRQS